MLCCVMLCMPDQYDNFYWFISLIILTTTSENCECAHKSAVHLDTYFIFAYIKWQIFCSSIYFILGIEIICEAEVNF